MYRLWAWAGMVVLLVAVLASGACNRGSDDSDVSYVQQLEADRARKDQDLATTPNSPIPANRRQDLLPLSYFPPDPTYVVPAVLERASTMPTGVMMTSTGQQRLMRRVGTLRFTLRGQQLSLGAFVENDAPDLDRLFVPFMDMTSGTESYPAGRYLDLHRTATDIYEIDFNRAYQPYCYYNPTYDCPYPPPENRLKVPVRAGERLHQSVTH